MLKRSCAFNNSFDDEDDELSLCSDYIRVFGDAECIDTPIEIVSDNEAIDDDDDEEYENYEYKFPLSGGQSSLSESEEISWRNYVKVIQFDPQKHNPLIGREAEIARTLQVL